MLKRRGRPATERQQRGCKWWPSTLNSFQWANRCARGDVPVWYLVRAPAAGRQRSLRTRCSSHAKWVADPGASLTEGHYAGVDDATRGIPGARDTRVRDRGCVSLALASLDSPRRHGRLLGDRDASGGRLERQRHRGGSDGTRGVRGRVCRERSRDCGGGREARACLDRGAPVRDATSRTALIQPAESRLNSWVRCIWSARGSPRSRGPRAMGRQCGARRRWRSTRRLGAVCLWCARDGRVPHSRRSRLTQPISGGDRRCQGPPVRAERSEPRSGGLDCRRAVELCRSQVGGLRALWSQRVRETGAEASWEGSSLLARKAAWLRKRRRAGARVHALQRSRHSERLGCGDIHEDCAGEDLGLLVAGTAEQPCAPESSPADLVVGDGIALALRGHLDVVEAPAAGRAGGLAVRKARGPAA
jgi:hypothetical protein